MVKRRKRPRRSSKVSKRTTVTRRVNKKGYTNKYGTRVGPYNRKVSRFPNTYTTYRMINGKYRVCKITRKNGKEYVQVLDDKRRAKPITFAEAKKHFESLPENRQEADKRFRAKNTFEKDEITSSYITKTGTSRYDVEGIDTPLDKFIDKEPKISKPTRKEYEQAEVELRKAKNKFFNKNEITDVEEDLVVGIEDRPGILTMDRRGMLTTPEMFEGSRIDRITKNDKHTIKELPSEFYVDSYGERHFDSHNHFNYYDLEQVEKIVKKMDKETLEMYYGSDVENKGFSPLVIKDKDFVYALAPITDPSGYIDDDIKEAKNELEATKKIKKKLNSELEKAKDPKKVTELLDSIQDKDININHLESELETLEEISVDTKENKPIFDIKSNTQEYSKLKDMTKEELIMLGDIDIEKAPTLKGKLIYEVLNKQKDKEYQQKKKDIEQALELKGSISGYWKTEDSPMMGTGIKNKENISFVTNSKDFENSEHYRSFQNKYKEIDYSNSSLIYEDDNIYFVSPDKNVMYKYDLVSDALKEFEDPKIYYAEGSPLWIKGKDRTMAIAPRMTEDEVEETIPVKDYQRLSKLSKKELAIKSNPSYKTEKVTGQKDYWIAQAYNSENKKEKVEKPAFTKYRYYLLNRPPTVGTIPREYDAIKKEDFGKRKDIPEEKISAFGYVEYKDPLNYNEMSKFDLVPENDVEWANYMFYLKCDKSEAEARKIKNQYLELSLEELKKNSERDHFCNYAYIIKKAEA